MPALVEQATPRELAVVAGVRVWSIDLAPAAPVVAAMTERLSAAERDRAARLGTGPARCRFVVARASLRSLLSGVTGTPAEKLAIRSGRDGKPFLEPADGRLAPEFNLSHARDLAVIGIGDDRPVGIDLEWTGGSSPIEAIARRFFSAAEQARLEDAPVAGRRKLFFRIWVRKEAYLKGRGEGISEWIHRTDFSSTAAWPGPGRDQDAWLVRDLVGLPPGCVASLAVAREAPRGARLGAPYGITSLVAGSGDHPPDHGSGSAAAPRPGPGVTQPGRPGERAP